MSNPLYVKAKGVLKIYGINLIDSTNAEEMQGELSVIVKDMSVFDDMLSRGSIAFGEGYVNGKWDSANLDKVIEIMLWNKLDDQLKPQTWGESFRFLLRYLFNYQSKTKSLDVAKVHYDIGNDVYTNMLGKSMAYTCAYWEPDNDNDLDRAQFAKYELICQKLKLKDGMEVLDLGSGFGCLAVYMAKHYNCNVTCVNISKEQLKYTREICEKENLTHKIRCFECDYRDAPLYLYDRVVTVGMVEHVGPHNYKTLFETINKRLKDGGLALVHGISSHTTMYSGDPWVTTYIFPELVGPSAKLLASAFEGLFILEHWQDIGPCYYKTLKCWYANYRNAVNEGKLKVDQRFDRMWTFYLLVCAGLYKARQMALYQIVLSKRRQELYRGLEFLGKSEK